MATRMAVPPAPVVNVPHSFVGAVPMMSKWKCSYPMDARAVHVCQSKTTVARTYNVPFVMMAKLKYMV